MLVSPLYFKPDCITCQRMTHSLLKPETINTFSISGCVFVSMLPLPALGFVSPISLCYLLQHILCLLQHHLPFQGITILHCCKSSGVETEVRWSGSSMRRKTAISWVFLRSTFLDVPCRRFSGSGSYRKPVTSQLHVNTTQWQHEKEQYFSLLLSFSMLTIHSMPLNNESCRSKESGSYRSKNKDQCNTRAIAKQLNIIKYL